MIEAPATAPLHDQPTRTRGAAAHAAIGSPPAPEIALLEPRGRDGGPRLLGARYAVGELLGRGASSAVYAARDQLLDREVALKVFTALAEDPEQLRIEETEARLLARLHHESLISIFDAGIDSTGGSRPRIYLVTERMHGGDLKHRLLEGTLTPRQVARLGADLAKGLRHVHEQGVLHRDVKPANVLLAHRAGDARIRAKLADFGIASRIGTAQGELTMGTAAYLSPEQFDGAEASPASDIYSLGLVLLEALTGVLEFPGPLGVCAQTRRDRDARVPESVPPALAVTLRAMLRREPEDRADLTTVADALDAFGAADTVPRAPERRTSARSDLALDPPPDETLAHITSLASRLVDVPIAFVSIVDDQRTEVRCCLGLDIAGPDIVPDGLCAVPTRSVPSTVADVHDDARLRNDPILIAHPGLRAYAVVPLTLHDGHVIGALGVFDRRARQFSDRNLADLGELAMLLTREWELRLAVRRVLSPHSMA